MPAAGIAAAIATGVSAAGAAALSAIGTVSLAGLAQGAAIVGTGLSVVGRMTGSKTLTNIGMGIGMAGGIGMLASGVSNAAMAAGSASSLSSGAKGLLNSTNEALSAPTKGSGLKTFPSSTVSIGKTAGSSADAFYKASDAIDGSFNPEFEKNYFQRANDTLTKYNTLLNVAGGMGQAYMVGKQMDLQKDLQGNQLAFDQQLVDRVNRNNGTVLTGVNPVMDGTTRDVNAYSGILRGQI